MDWSSFLEVARCPGRPAEPICGGELERTESGLRCRQCFASYGLNPMYGFPLFAPRSEEEKKGDKYEDPSQRLAEEYLGLWAFGYLFLGRGEAEGFYRAINELAVTLPLAKEGKYRILEIGCGVGRTVCDFGRYFSKSLVIGVDLVERMLEHAYPLVVSDKAVPPVDLEPNGFKGNVRTATGFGLGNVFLAQADALRLPCDSGQFDLVVSPNVIDRVPDPEKLIQEVARVLKQGGHYIFTDPFNWTRTPERWADYRALDGIERLLRWHGLQTEVAFDGLVYRELLDARGAHTDWSVAFVRAVKA